MSNHSAKHGEDFACYTPPMAQHAPASSGAQPAGLTTSDPTPRADATLPPTRATRRARRNAARLLRAQRAKARILRRRAPTAPSNNAATVSPDATTATPDDASCAQTPAPAAAHPANDAASASTPRRLAPKASTKTALTYDTELGVVSRNIARLASNTLAWLRGPDIVPTKPRMPLFGFIHYDVVQQFQEAPILGLTQFLPYREQHAFTRQDVREHPPLILIHGLAGAPGNFAPIRVWLSMHRPRPIHVFDYREYGDMFPAADAFAAWLQTVFDQYPSHVRFEILAHSMGGLISRLALLDATLAQRIGHVLTLGTPHQGTRLARLGGSTYLKQLQVDSEVFQRLQAHESRPLPYDLTSVWTERDILVLPSIHATLPGYPSYAMHQSTHLSWLLHPRLIDQVFNILDARRMAAQDVRIPGTPAAVDPA